MSPLSNSYVRPEQLSLHENFYPLHAWVCEMCLLVQLEEFEPPERIFTGEYAYFSSYSDSWLQHAKAYVDSMIERFALGPDQLAVEIASNDGYLLQYFAERGVQVLGIEPAANCAREAEKKGVPTVVKFFGAHTADELVRDGKRANLLIGNNVLAHVPDLNDFVRGIKRLLAPDGILTMEFPHLLRLMEENQFDTIYHEHFSYFSFMTVQKVFAHHGIEIFDVEELSTHGGSLRIYGRHAEDSSKPVQPRVAKLVGKENLAELNLLQTYAGFDERVKRTKRHLLQFLIKAKEEGLRVAGYGAPAKGNTLLNYCGVRSDFLDFTVDRSPHKQGCFLPGTRIPVFHPDKLKETRPDYVLILPWNLREEIMAQASYIGEWGGKFVIPIPDVAVLP